MVIEAPIKVSVDKLNAYFRTTHAIKDVSLSVPENSVLAIIGPSGCGKSTFVRCLNRMHELVPGARQSGKVLVDGQDLHAKRVDPVNLRRRGGKVFQIGRAACRERGRSSRVG